MTRNVITFREDTPVEEIASTLTSKRITGAPVIANEGHVVGIVSETDVFSKRGKTARDIMSPRVISVTEETGIDEAARLLIGERIRRVPVIRGGKMVGLLSRSDVLDFFAKGFPDFDTDSRILDAAAQALREGYNQYATTWGAPALRQAIARKQSAAWGRSVDPDTEVTVSCGATEAMIAAMLAAVDPGDEVVVFEPYYENYGPDCVISGAVPRYVTLRPPDWSFDGDQLRAAFNAKTRAIVVNTPHNPSGKVFSRDELELIAGLCIEHDAIAITDEIYEHLVYRGKHLSMATMPGMAERTITISGASKTYSVTGWRIGWLIAPPALSAGIRQVHDFP